MGQKRFTGYVPFPKLDDGRVDKKSLKEMYFTSKYIEWSLFCNHFGYNPYSRPVPVTKWKEEKRSQVVEEKTAEIKEKLFEHSHFWHNEILDTVKNFPIYNNNFMAILNRYTSRIARAMQEEDARIAAGEKIDLKDSYLMKFDAKYLSNLATAFKTIQEAKYKSVLLDQWTTKIAEDRVKDPEAANKLEETAGDLNFEVMTPGGMKMTDKELTAFLGQFYDSPYKSESQVFIEHQDDKSNEE